MNLRSGSMVMAPTQTTSACQRLAGAIADPLSEVEAVADDAARVAPLLLARYWYAMRLVPGIVSAIQMSCALSSGSQP